MLKFCYISLKILKKSKNKIMVEFLLGGLDSRIGVWAAECFSRINQCVWINQYYRHIKSFIRKKKNRFTHKNNVFGK